MSEVKRNEKGHPLPGQSLRKATARTNARKLSRRIARNTRNGEELLELRLQVARDPTHRDWDKAMKALEERLWGKAVQAVDLHHSGDVGSKSPLEGLTAEQLLEVIRAGK